MELVIRGCNCVDFIIILAKDLVVFVCFLETVFKVGFFEKRGIYWSPEGV
jgi:hypothetical protein